MPTRRTKLAARRVALSPAAIDAWQQGDFHGLARALDLMPFQPHPWPYTHTSLGCDQGPCPAALGDLWRSGWARAQALQKALYEAAGEPGRMDRHGRPLGPA